MLKAISLFSGVGGLDFGLEAVGFRIAVAVEMDPDCCKTIKLNRRWPLLEGDVHQISSRAILRAGGLRKGEADLLVAGPPCQPFSKSSYWVSGDALRLDDPRADTLAAYLRVLRDTKPKAFLLENVYGIAYKGKSEGLKLLLRGIHQINAEAGTNYSAHCAVLNAADYGVPQTRERVFLVGARSGAQFVFPAHTHGASNGRLLPSSLEPYRTAWQALGDLVTPAENDPALTVGGRWGDLLPSIPPVPIIRETTSPVR